VRDPPPAGAQPLARNLSYGQASFTPLDLLGKSLPRV
jgi:hypothetical protein